MERDYSAELTREFPGIFETAQALSRPGAKEKYKLEAVRWAKQFWSAMTMRKNVVYSNPEKIKKALEVLKAAKSEKKWILFNKSIKFAEELQKALIEAGLSCEIYHSKLTKKLREETLKKFSGNKFNILIGVDALTEGLNVPDIDGAISLSGTSVGLTMIQALGRAIRFREGKKAIFVNLYTENTIVS